MDDENKAQQAEFRAMLGTLPTKKKKDDHKPLYLVAALGVIVLLAAALLAGNRVDVNIENNVGNVEEKPATSAQWSSLHEKLKDEIKINAYAKFPEILQYRQKGKFDDLNEWLRSEGIIHPNIRDIFRKYEGKEVLWKGKSYNDLPGIYATLIFRAEEVKAHIKNTNTPPNNLGSWKSDVRRYADYEVDGVKVSDIILEQF